MDANSHISPRSSLDHYFSHLVGHFEIYFSLRNIKKYLDTFHQHQQHLLTDMWQKAQRYVIIVIIITNQMLDNQRTEGSGAIISCITHCKGTFYITRCPKKYGGYCNKLFNVVHIQFVSQWRPELVVFAILNLFIIFSVLNLHACCL